MRVLASLGRPRALILLDGGYLQWEIPGMPIEDEIRRGAASLGPRRTADPDAAVEQDLETLRRRYGPNGIGPSGQPLARLWTRKHSP